MMKASRAAKDISSTEASKMAKYIRNLYSDTLKTVPREIARSPQAYGDRFSPDFPDFGDNSHPAK